MAIPIFVSGSSREAHTIASYMRRLEKSGYVITFDWTVPVLEHESMGVPDRELTDEAREKYATLDLDAIRATRVFWQMVPKGGSIGSWVEFGYALGGIPFLADVIVSGDWKKSIFTSLAGHRFDDHEGALRWLEERAR